ncbi:hypothetical protein GA0115240_163513 [Streptomyces sp. DvalAA-14]|uniref:hypothetical protein n=1 Tax=unclassified Streptomyces TaxID=2593676 RepID=UPI00081B2E3B|nr:MULTISPECIES: hypothetical protein [unclassified Streptomyces]MYS24339.1 hypothetical protein [Streptomyces sp. SID4948]SCE45125.1 hypothetical protein GA0115240_163513 [Streptomyces sp. DvalAA-14]
MSTEIPPTDPTAPVPPVTPAPPKEGPDNWHTDGTAEAPADGLLTGQPTKKPAQVKPDNWHTDSKPAV